jgi:hypothetical protein
MIAATGRISRQRQNLPLGSREPTGVDAICRYWVSKPGVRLLLGWLVVVSIKSSIV